LDRTFHPIRLDGYLDIGRYPEFRTAFERVPAELPVLIDISGATGVDSVFLSELLMLRRRHALPVAVILPADPRVARIFSITGIGAKMGVFERREEALAALSSPPEGLELR
jgi:anti-anti-sigma regulatory factor